MSAEVGAPEYDEAPGEEERNSPVVPGFLSLPENVPHVWIKRPVPGTPDESPDSIGLGTALDEEGADSWTLLPPAVHQASPHAAPPIDPSSVGMGSVAGSVPAQTGTGPILSSLRRQVNKDAKIAPHRDCYAEPPESAPSKPTNGSSSFGSRLRAIKKPFWR